MIYLLSSVCFATVHIAHIIRKLVLQIIIGSYFSIGVFVIILMMPQLWLGSVVCGRSYLFLHFFLCIRPNTALHPLD